MLQSPTSDAANRLITTVIVVRHGERLDYICKGSGDNWIPTAPEPWNPPLTETGCLQGYKLGTFVPSILKRNNISPKVSAVYSSPLLRCLQTSSNVLRGLVSATTENDKQSVFSSLRVRVEQGLMESMYEDWYRSWCLPGSDSTWGYRDPSNEDLSEESMHPMAKLPIQSGILPKLRTSLSSAVEICDKEAGNAGEEKEEGPKMYPLLVDTEHGLDKSVHPIEQPYRWGTCEPYSVTKERLLRVVESLAEKHKGETIILCSHGGPVTHLYGSLMKVDPKLGSSHHGPSKYTCTSVYTRLEGEANTQPWTNIMVNDISHLDDKMREDLKSHWN